MPKPYAAALLAICALAAAEPRIERTPSRLAIALDGGVELHMALDGDLLLGLGGATAAGVVLMRDGILVAPSLADEYGSRPWVTTGYRLREARPVDGGGVELVADILASEEESARRAVFVFGPDRERVLREGMTPELTALRAAAEAGEEALRRAVDGHPEVIAAVARRAEREQRERARGGTPREIGDAIDGETQRIERTRQKAEPEVATRDPSLRAHLDARAAWLRALDVRGLELGRIHRDLYQFAHMQLPAEACRVERLRALAAAPSTAIGTLRWTFHPERRRIAGWTWAGWRHAYRFELAGGRRAAALRQLGAWAIGGDLAGGTAVNFRYRGLGGIEQPFTAGPDGGVRECFTTTEIMPGAIGGAQVVSPALPATLSVDDRGYGLMHRSSAWICRMARGAGVSALDFAFAASGAHASFFPIAGDIRSLTEAFPGDRALSQTNEHLFPLSAAAASQPEIHLALAGRQTAQEWRTRWAEMDRHVRDLHAAELGMVQHEARPAVGCNIDSGWGPALTGLAKRMDEFAAAGVKMLYVHHPGWWNGRQREPGQVDLPRRIGGGDCAIWEWKPLSAAGEPWREVQRAGARTGIGYHIWITGMSVKDAPFFTEVGADLRRWAINAPGMEVSSGYPPNLFNHNIRDARFREIFGQRMADLRRDYGFQGFWADSYQNLFMSTLDWAGGEGAPLQRLWWERIAAWTRDGIAWTGESHSMPGLSCSIEVPPGAADLWYFGDTVRWFRTDLPDPGTAIADRRLFLAAANRGWLAPQVGGGKRVEASFPGFAGIAAAYERARPDMRRKYILPDDRGVLWLPYAGDGGGVLFALADMPVPAGIAAAPIAGGDAPAAFAAGAVYRVSGADLFAAFAVRRPPEADERIGRSWSEPATTWPAWAADKP